MKKEIDESVEFVRSCTPFFTKEVKDLLGRKKEVPKNCGLTERRKKNNDSKRTAHPEGQTSFISRDNRTRNYIPN